jgi:serine phosphatase RsbU (regulator of sigma subunit)
MIILISILIILSLVMYILMKIQYKRLFILNLQEKKFEVQRDIVINQHKKIEYQKEEITSSIIAAKKIQQALLPSESMLKEILKDFFIFYKPRDIVSGDFYWVSKRNKKIIIVAADCTGHGVPGALMSMLGISFLNEIINKEDNIYTAVILNKLRDRIIEALTHNGIEAKEGMDISIAIINEENLEMYFSGAFNSCYVIRNCDIIEIKADSMPIGFMTETDKPFTSQKFQLKEGDHIYFTSDGFQDQFGGPRGKKLKSKIFKEFLLRLQNRPMKEQGMVLEEYFDQWKGLQDQVDDVMVIGICVK